MLFRVKLPKELRKKQTDFNLLVFNSLHERRTGLTDFRYCGIVTDATSLLAVESNRHARKGVEFAFEGFRDGSNQNRGAGPAGRSAGADEPTGCFGRRGARGGGLGGGKAAAICPGC